MLSLTKNRHQSRPRSRSQGFLPTWEGLEARQLLASYTVNDPADIGDKDLDDGKAETVNGTVTLQAIWMQAQHDNDFQLNITFAGGLKIPSVSAAFSAFTVQMTGTGVSIGTSLSFGAASNMTGIRFEQGFSVGSGSVLDNCSAGPGGGGVGIGSNSQVLHCTFEGSMGGSDGNVVTSSTIGKNGVGNLSLRDGNSVSNTTVQGGLFLRNDNSADACTILNGGVSLAANNDVTGNFIVGPVSVLGSGSSFDNNIVQDGGLRVIGDFSDPAVGVTVSNNTFRNGTGLQLSYVKDSTIKGNTIFGSDTWGIQLGNDDGPTGQLLAGRNKISGNKIGLDEQGSLAGNALGISIVGSSNDTIGGTNAGDGNVIVGTINAGIKISTGKKYVIQGNFVGTNASGAPNMGNQSDGIQVNGEGENTVGGSTAGAGNTVASNGRLGTGSGIRVSGNKNVIQGNKVGRAKKADPESFGHPSVGVMVTGNDNTIGGTSAAAANLIGGQTEPPFAFATSSPGLSVTGDRNVIQGNRIGTDQGGAERLGNAGGGMIVSGKSNTIGGTTEAAGNVIAFNGFGDRPQIAGAGILIGGGKNSEKNTIRLNSIYGNFGRGIRLADFKHTINDPGRSSIKAAIAQLVLAPDTDEGANTVLNYPVITSVSNGGGVHIKGTLRMKPYTTFTLDFYANDDASVHPSGFGDGQTYLGSTTALTDLFGHGFFDITLPSKGSGTHISATATDPDGNTSGFSLVDTDGDGLADAWETMGKVEPGKRGIDFDEDGKVDLELEGADPMHKDIYLEFDAMAGYAPDPIPTKPIEGILLPVPQIPPGVQPTNTSLDYVIDAFGKAPMSVNNPDGRAGINLHLQPGGELSLPAVDWGSLDPYGFPTGFNDTKKANFGTPAERQNQNTLDAKRLVYRYCIFAKSVPGRGGESEILGNDMMVLLGTDAFGGRTALDQAGTFMHELGHTLGLQHGGGGSNDFGIGDGFNGKPNYHSVMNYIWTVPNELNRFAPDNVIVPDYASSWRLDYSRTALPTLFEGVLNENNGIGGQAGLFVPIGPVIKVSDAKPQYIQQLVAMNGPVDWNGNGVKGNGEIQFGRDINGNVITPSGFTGDPLVGHEDWPFLTYSFLDFGQGYEFAAGYSGDFHDIITDESGSLPGSGGGGTSADLAITHDGTQQSATVGQPFTYTLQVKNNGPDASASVVVTDTLPGGATFQSAAASQGSFTINQGVVTFTLGQMAASGVATLTIVITPSSAGTIRNTAHVEPTAADPVTSNNTANLYVSVQPVPVTVPKAQISTVKIKKKKVKAIVLTFSDSLASATVGRLSLYRLADAGKDKKYGTSDDKLTRLKAATYNAVTRSITLQTKQALNLKRPLQLIISGGLLDALGRPIDGDRDGKPGGDVIALVSKKGVVL